MQSNTEIHNQLIYFSLAFCNFWWWWQSCTSHLLRALVRLVSPILGFLHLIDALYKCIILVHIIIQFCLWTMPVIFMVHLYTRRMWLANKLVQYWNGFPVTMLGVGRGGGGVGEFLITVLIWVRWACASSINLLGVIWAVIIAHFLSVHNHHFLWNTSHAHYAQPVLHELVPSL